VSDLAVPRLIASLLERLEGEEALDLELKAARGGLPRDLWPTLSAFANTRGGWVVLGVADRGGTLIVEGVPHPSTLLQQLNDQIRNPQKLSFPICGATDSRVERLGEYEIVVLRVPAAPRRVRPVYVEGNPYSGTYVRRHAGDYRCTKPEVDRMMREASDVAADTTILARYDWGDLDREGFARYRRRYQVAHRTSPWNGYDDDLFLRAIGGFRRDKETGEEGITVAGLPMFGTPEAIRARRGRHLIDYRQVERDAGPDVRWTDRVVWEGNLLGAFEAIYPRLTADLPVPFRMEGAVRVDEGPLHGALREALVNLLVHADYAETEASLILRSEEGYDLRNPGSSRVLESDLLIGNRSDPRNPELVRMFRLIGLAEEAGTGIPKITQAWRALGLQLPKIDVGTERYEFSLRLRYAHLLSEDDRRWLRDLGERWSEAEQLALVLARHEGEIDNPTLRRLTGQHPADVTKVLGNLRDRELLQMIGGGRAARYQLGPAATLAPARPPVAGETPQVGLPEVWGIPADSGDLTGKFGDSKERSGDSSDAQTASAAESGTLWEELRRRAAPVRDRSYVNAQTRDDVVVQLCLLTPLSLRELAELLQRSKDHTRAIVASLVALGRLTYLYPDQPNHPRQRYVAAEALVR
jgi:ATP-dependent DNA helicase RecG